MAITETDPISEANWEQIRDFLKAFVTSYGATGELFDRGRYFPIFSNLETVLTKYALTSTPSLFKRSSAFILSFLQQSPLRTPIPAQALGDTKEAKCLVSIPNHQNALAAFEVVRFALTGAVIEHRTRGPIVLERSIEVSTHFLCDLVHALSRVDREDVAFHLLSLTIESLVYAANETASNPRIA